MAMISTVALSESNTTVVVKASTPTWGYFTENTVGGQTGGYALGPTPAPLGTGSAQMTLAAANEGQALGTQGLPGPRCGT